MPHTVAVLIFLTLTLVYFSPALEGKDIKQDDAIGSMGWGKDAKDYHEESGEYCYWSNSMFSGMPCNYTYAPQPANTFEPAGELLTLHVFGASRRHIGCIFATFVGCYILFLALGCRPWLSIAGSIVYTLGSYNFIIIGAGHMNKSLVIATMAPIVGGIILCYKRKLLLGALVTLIFAGLNIYWSHQQMSYYTAIIAAFIAVVYLVYAYREKWMPYYWKATGMLALVAVLSIAPAVGILFPTADYAKESVRGGSELPDEEGNTASGLDSDYAFRWSYGKMETLTLLVPNLYGSATYYNLGEDSETFKLKKQRIIEQYGLNEKELDKEIKRNPDFKRSLEYDHAYWGPQSLWGTSGPVYVGAIVCLLFVLGLFIVRGPEKWWLAGVTLFSLILAWGGFMESINSFLFEYMPLYNKFRAPSQALVITTLTMCILAILAVKRFMEMVTAEKQQKNAQKALLLSTAITGGILLLLILSANSLFGFTGEIDAQTGVINDKEMLNALVADRKSMFYSDAWRSLGFVMAAGVLLYAFTYFRKIKNEMLIGALALLFIFDMWPVCQRFMNDDMFMPKKAATEIAKTEADELIHRVESNNKYVEGNNKYRVIDMSRGNIFNQSFTSYHHNSIGGYSPAKLSRYQDLIDFHIAPEIQCYANSLESLNKRNNATYMNVIGLLADKDVLNMLNTKYLIMGKAAESVIENPYAFGHCWFVDRIVWVDGAVEEMEALDNVSRNVAYVDKRWKENIGNAEQYDNDADGDIELTGYPNPGNLIYKSNSDAPKLAVFSDIYYKTWKAYIDGEEVTPIRVNYVLRALPVPAGEHTIEFKCVDELMETSHTWSLYLSILVGMVIIGLVALIIYRKVKGLDE